MTAQKNHLFESRGEFPRPGWFQYHIDNISLEMQIPYLHTRGNQSRIYWHDNFTTSNMRWLKHFFYIFFPGGDDAWYAMKLHRNYERRRAKLRKKVYNPR